MTLYECGCGEEVKMMNLEVETTRFQNLVKTISVNRLAENKEVEK